MVVGAALVSRSVTFGGAALIVWVGGDSGEVRIPTRQQNQTSTRGGSLELLDVDGRPPRRQLSASRRSCS